MRFGCCITRPKNTQSEYVILTDTAWQQQMRQRGLNVTLHAHCLSNFFLLLRQTYVEMVYSNQTVRYIDFANTTLS